MHEGRSTRLIHGERFTGPLVSLLGKNLIAGSAAASGSAPPRRASPFHAYSNTGSPRIND